MVNKCAAPQCKYRYLSNIQKQFASFHFPIDQNLNQLGIRFINRSDWILTKNSVLCELHFEDKCLTRGDKCTLNWHMKLDPSKYFCELLQIKSSLPVSKTTRNSPKKRIFRKF